MLNATVGHWNDLVIPEYFYGHVRLETRMRHEGNRIIGEGRAWHYDGQGRLIKDTGWEPTGVTLTWE